MKPEMRTIVWETIERLFRELRLSFGTPFPIAVMVEVRKEVEVATVRAELQRLGIEVVEVTKSSWPFGRRWRLAAKAPARPITRTEIDSWLDMLDAKLSPHDAAVVTWVCLTGA